MSRETSLKGKVGYLQRFLARLNSNKEELQHIEPSRAQFEGLCGQIHEAADLQAFHTAGKQEASRRLQGFLNEAERLATVLQMAVKQHYGIRSEKLADFGLQPFRGRNKSSRKTDPPSAEPAAPAADRP